MFSRVLRSPDSVGGGTAKATATGEGPSASSPREALGQAGQAARATEAEAGPIGGPDGTLPDLRIFWPGPGTIRHDLSPDAVRLMLDDCTKFLWQLANITSGVLETMDIGQVRKIVAENVPLKSFVIGEDGRPAKGDDPSTSSGQAPRGDHRKEPRGRKHPVITLIQFALQGVRMLIQITGATNPNVYGNETFEQKKQREALKEQERTFNKLLRGG